MTTREHLEALLAATTADQVMVPRAWLEAALQALPDGASPTLPPADLSVPEIADRWRRSASFVRAQLAAGVIAGAYQRHGRWLVPAEALLAHERARATPAPLHLSPSRRREAPAPGESAFDTHLRQRRSA